MAGLTFNAWRGEDFIPLLELLVVVGGDGLDLRWNIEDAEFSGNWAHTGDLHQVSDAAETLTFLQLIDLVSDGVQMIEGRVIARERGSHAAIFCAIQSNRGDSWDVWGPERLLSDIRNRFSDADRLPATQFDPV